MISFRLVSLVLLGFSAFSATAHAQSPGSIRELRGSGSTYEVAFDDDPLQALDGKATIARIRLLHDSMRVLLIRPRTSFVSEMLKSVEDM